MAEAGRLPAVARPARLDPVLVAFAGSLLLSVVAILGSVGPNRDGMLYLDTARVFLESGYAAAQVNFDWPFLPVTIALLSKATGLGLESAAYLYCGLLLAGACAAVVALSRRLFPEAAWMACLVTLALPAFNVYRTDLLREFGFWLFSLVAFLLALRWAERPGWGRGLAAQLSLAAAALFRLEAVAFYPALMLWACFAVRCDHRLRHFAMLASLALAGAVGAAVLVASGTIALDGRFEYYLRAIDPVAKVEQFRAAAAYLAEAVLNEYSANEADSILLFGLLSVIPVKFLQMTGVFVVPLGYAFAAHPLRPLLARWQPLAWVFAIYVVVLIAFLTHLFFLTSRYVSFLNLLAVPLIAVGMVAMLERHPRWRAPVVVLALLVALANVVSLSPKKTHYRDAGRWLAVEAAERTRSYVEDPRIAYHAGWPYAEAAAAVLGREPLAEALRAGRFDLAALDVAPEDADLSDWLRVANAVERVRFTNRAGDAVVIVAPRR